MRLRRTMPSRLPSLAALAVTLTPVAAQVPTVDLLQARAHALAFGHAGAVLRVTVAEAGAGPVGVRIREVVHGFRVPRPSKLAGFAGAEPGSQWLVATSTPRPGDATLWCLARLPDTAANLQRVRGSCLPIHRDSPLVFLASVEVKGSTILFRDTEVLRGALPRRTVEANHWQHPVHWPGADAGGRFLVAAFGVHPPVASGRQLVEVRTLRAVGEEELPGLRAAFAAELPGAGHRDLAGDRAALQRRSEAWRFMRAPLVARAWTVLGGEAQATGAGGTFLSFLPSAWLRPVDPAQPVSGRPRIILPFVVGHAPGALFRMGGHAQYFPGIADDVLCAGARRGGPASVYVPAEPANVERVRGWLAARPPRFAAWSGPHVLPGATDVFDGEVDLAALAVGRSSRLGAWLRFEVVARGTVQCEGRPAPTIRVRCIGQRLPALGLAGAEWTFAGRVGPDWPVGSRWWGYALADQLPLPRPETGARGDPDRWVFLPGTFLPGGREEALGPLLDAIARSTLGGPPPSPFGALLDGQRAQSCLAHARELLDATFTGGPGERCARLDAVLGALADALPAAASYRIHGLEDAGRLGDPPLGSALEIKLGALALFLKEQPAYFQAIRHHYLRPGRGVAPPLREEHCAPGYRLAWEFALLNPRPDAPVEWHDRAARALGRIAHPASLLTLREAYRIASVPGVDEVAARAARKRCLAAIATQPSAAGWEALLACRAMSRASGAAAWDPDGHLLLVLATAGPARVRAWREVLLACATEGLDASAREFLAEARGRLAAAGR